jgi:hypothetical protein
MKFVKLSVFALSLGFFAVSCNNETPAETPATDTTATVEAPAVEATPATPADTTVAAPAADTAAAAAPAAEQAAPAAH